MVGLGNLPAATVADRLHMSVADVWAAKSRTVGRLRQILHDLEAAYDSE
jgi:hypothetical protein